MDELTILYGGDTGIAFGSAVEHFQMTNGSDVRSPRPLERHAGQGRTTSG